MKKSIFIIVLFCCLYTYKSNAQVNTNRPVNNTITDENAFIDASTNFNDANSLGKGLIFPRTNLTTWQFKTDALDGINFPTAFDGMIVYNTGTGSTISGQGQVVTVTPGFYYFSNPDGSNNVTNGQWVRLVSGSSANNGTAQFSSVACTTASSGTLTVGTPASAVTQTITVTVTTAGSYNLTATANGVTFSASAANIPVGTQNIVLTASGTPIAQGSFSYQLNTTPICPFTRTVNSPTSNGTATYTYTNCNFASSGVLTNGTAVSGVTQTVQVDVTTTGTYSISTGAVNGVTFVGSGSFASTGLQTIVLNATGTPSAFGSQTYTLNTTPSCSFTRNNQSSTTNGTALFTVTNCNNPVGNLTVNVAASGVTQTIQINATALGTYSISATNNGLTFLGSGTIGVLGPQTIVLTASGIPTSSGSFAFFLNLTTPNNCNFTRTVISPTSNGTATLSFNNCSKTENGTLIAGTAPNGVSQVINVTITGTQTYNLSTNTVNGVTFFASGSVPFTSNGTLDITLNAIGTPIESGTFSYTLNTTPSCTFTRTVVSPISNGTAAYTYTNCNFASSGVLTNGTAVSGVTQTVQVNVTTTGTYSISTGAVNGVTFAASGSFASTGLQTIVLNATGTPSAFGSQTYILNTSPSCSFTRNNQSSTTNGTALFTITNCGTSTGNLFVGVPASGVTQILNINATVLGTYSLSTINNNGVTFSGSGTIDVLGPQTIVLTASGSVVNISGNNSFTINAASPNTCSFIRNFVYPSSNGTVNFNITNCNTASSGILMVGTPVSSVTQTLTINVGGAGGTYNLSATANGVTFSGSGTVNAGLQDIVLSASGTPQVTGPTTFTLNTTPSCTFTRTVVSPISNGTAAYTYTNCNFASSGVLTNGTAVSGVTQTVQVNVTTTGTYSISTGAVNGVTFAGSGSFASTGLQTIVLNATGTPSAFGSQTYILNTSPSCSFTRNNQSTTTNGTALFTITSCGTSTGNLYVGAPASATQILNINATVLGTYSLSTSNNNGVTFSGSGTIDVLGPQTIVLTASGSVVNISGNNSFTINAASPNNCSFIRNFVYPSSNGTAIFNITNCNTASSGILNVGTPVSSVSQTITVNVQSSGTFNLSATANGVIFTGSGTFPFGIGGLQNIVLNASGTPQVAGPTTFTLNNSEPCSFTFVTQP